MIFAAKIDIRDVACGNARFTEHCFESACQRALFVIREHAGRSGGKSIAPKHGAEIVRQRKFAAILGIRRRGVIFSYFRNQKFRRTGNGEFAVRGRHEKRIAAAHDFIADFAFAAYARNGAETCGVGFQTFFAV